MKKIILWQDNRYNYWKLAEEKAKVQDAKDLEDLYKGVQDNDSDNGSTSYQSTVRPIKSEGKLVNPKKGMEDATYKTQLSAWNL